MKLRRHLFIVGIYFVSGLSAQDTSRVVSRNLEDYATTIEIEPTEMTSQEDGTPSSLLLAGRNYFLNTYGFNFYNVRFRQRGYENISSNNYINAIPINSLETNNVQFNLFPGLNNAMPVEETTEQLGASDFNFGGLGNHFLMNAFAGRRSKSAKIGYAISNRNYKNRLYGQYYSGYNQNGWSYSLAFNLRYSHKGYNQGTYYNGGTVLLSLDKQWRKSTFSFSLLLPDYESGRSSPTVKEVYQLVGDNYYNPAWGIQGNKVRSANVFKSFLPSVLLSHKTKLNEHFCLQSGIGFSKGKSRRSGLDWYHAPDPRPDYYRYLPSYFKESDPDQATELYNSLKNDASQLQIDWSRLYNINRSQTDERSRYIVSGQYVENTQLNIGAAIHGSINRIWNLAAGLQYQDYKTRNYRQVEDLLGGSYWLNVNSFVNENDSDDPSVIQNDVDHPNQKIVIGQKYSYDYTMKITQFREWLQLSANMRKLDFYWGAEIYYRQLERVGYVRNGLFPDQSLGKDRSEAFSGFNHKVGATYKIDGRQYLMFSAGYLHQPPTPDLIYVSPRTRDAKYEDASSVSIKSAEMSYVWNAPKIKLRSNVYYTIINNATESRYFYDDVHQNFATYNLSKIQKLHSGIELGLDWNLWDEWTWGLVSAFSESVYNNRPQLIVTSEVAKGIVLQEPVYLKNYKIANTPQSIVSSSFQYQHGNIWFAKLSCNVFFNRWSAMNPLRRTRYITQDINPVDQESLLAAVISQEKLPNGYMVDFFGGYSFLVNYKKGKRNAQYINILVSGNNLLGKKDIVSYAFEQMRMDLKSYNVDRFPNKYSYAMARNFYMGVSFRF